MLIGQYARAGTNGIIVYKSSSTNYPHSQLTTLNVDNTIKFVYDGTQYKYSLNGNEMTVADQNITLSNLIHVEGETGGTLRNIKIKLL